MWKSVWLRWTSIAITRPESSGPPSIPARKSDCERTWDGHALAFVTRFVDSAEMRARGIPPAFLFGSEQRGGTFESGKVRQRPASCGNQGWREVERTPVLSLRRRAGDYLQYGPGYRHRPVMVLATNAYTLSWECSATG